MWSYIILHSMWRWVCLYPFLRLYFLSLSLYHHHPPPFLLYFIYLKFIDRDERCGLGGNSEHMPLYCNHHFYFWIKMNGGSNNINWSSICVWECGTSIVRLNRISRWATDYITTKWIVVNSIVFHNSQTYANTHTCTRTHMCVYIFPFSIVFHFDGGGRVCWTACAHTLTLPQCVYKTHIFHPQCVLFIYMHAMWERRFIHRNKTLLETRLNKPFTVNNSIRRTGRKRKKNKQTTAAAFERVRAQT